MKGQTAYITFNALEEIFTFSDDYQELYRILFSHSDIMLDLSDDEFEKNKTEDVFLKTLLKREAEFYCFALADTFPKVEDFNFSERPTDLFILQEDPTECARLRVAHGVCIFSEEGLDETTIYQDRLEKSLQKGELAQATHQNGNPCEGWAALLQSLTLSPINSLIINDNYLFSNRNSGFQNVVNLLTTLLPKNLTAPFHILIVTYNEVDRKGIYRFNESTVKDIISDIRTALSYIKYSLEISFLTHSREDELHKRLILTNYHRIKSEHGYAAYTGYKVTMETDFDLQSNYYNVCTPNCDLALKVWKEYIRKIKHNYDSTKRAGNLPMIPTDIFVGYDNHRLLR